jgi:hypothetical protein
MVPTGDAFGTTRHRKAATKWFLRRRKIAPVVG